MRTPFHIRWAPSGAAEQPSPPPPEQAKFQDLLRELFQFDCADLDFGIYRIMNHKREGRRPLHRPGSTGRDRGGRWARARSTRRRSARASSRKPGPRWSEFFGDDAIAPSGELLKYQETPVGKKYMLWRERARHCGICRRRAAGHLQPPVFLLQPVLPGWRLRSEAALLAGSTPTSFPTTARKSISTG